MILAMSVLSGCATLVVGTSQTITVMTDPPGATCAFDRDAKSAGAVSSTPGSLRVDRSSKELMVTCSKDGFQPVKTGDSSHFTGATFGNIIAGGLIGVVVDAASGADSGYVEEMRLALVATPGSTPTAPDRAHCPEHNMQAGRSSGPAVVYGGPDPANPDACLQAAGAGPARSFYFALVPVDDADAAGRHDALKAVLYGPSGTVAHFTMGNASDQWTIDARMGDPEILLLNDKIVRARKLVLHKHQAGTMIEGDDTTWLDPIDGMPLKQTWVQSSGPKTNDQDWNVVVLVKLKNGATG
jgi:hypothetical protein